MIASAPPIVLEVRRSRQYDVALGAVTLVATISVWWSGLGLSFGYIALALVGLLAFRAARAHSNQVGVRLAVHADGRAGFRAPVDAEARDVRITDHAVIGPLVTLRFGAGVVPRSLFLLPDSTDADSLRRLRARLKGLAPADATERAIR